MGIKWASNGPGDIESHLQATMKDISHIYKQLELM